MKMKYNKKKDNTFKTEIKEKEKSQKQTKITVSEEE